MGINLLPHALCIQSCKFRLFFCLEKSAIHQPNFINLMLQSLSYHHSDDKVTSQSQPVVEGTDASPILKWLTEPSPCVEQQPFCPHCAYQPAKCLEFLPTVTVFLVSNSPSTGCSTLQVIRSTVMRWYHKHRVLLLSRLSECTHSTSNSLQVSF